LRLKSSIHAGDFGEHALQLVSVDTFNVRDVFHIDAAYFDEPHVIGIGGIQSHDQVGDLAGILSNFAIQVPFASAKVLGAGHCDKAIAAQLLQDGGSDLVCHDYLQGVIDSTPSV
jgi:hypothetical protein